MKNDIDSAMLTNRFFESKNIAHNKKIESIFRIHEIAIILSPLFITVEITAIINGKRKDGFFLMSASILEKYRTYPTTIASAATIFKMMFPYGMKPL